MKTSTAPVPHPADLQAQVAAQTRALAVWAATVSFEDLPSAVRRKAALVIADDMAAIIGARGEPELRAFHDKSLSAASLKEATVFRGGRQRCDRLSAAVANAVAADWLELDEGYRVVPCHAGLYSIPALLAEAEAENLPVSEILRAATIAYEVVTRVARAFVPMDDGILCHANYSTIGACAAVAAARRLDPQQFLNALSSAFTLSFAGPRNHVIKGALIRNTWPAVGAWGGMMSVEWARCGIHGLPESAYDALCVGLHATPRPERLINGLGSEWAILDSFTKIYACCQHAHSAAEAALEVRAMLPGDTRPEAIREITAEAHPLAMRLKSVIPATTLASKFSLPHVVSAALSTGDVGAYAFSSDALRDSRIASLRAKVRMLPYPETLLPPNDRPARISVSLHDGRSFQAECLSAAGGPDRPFGVDVLMHKLKTLTQDVYPRFTESMARIASLDEAPLQQGWREVVSDICGPA